MSAPASLRDVPLHDETDPLAEARTQLSVVTAEDPRAVAIVGAGLGYLTEAARERWPESVLVVLEPFRELADAAKKRTPGLYLSGRVHLLVGPDYDGAAALWKVFDAADAVSPSSGLSPSIVVHPVLAQAAPAEMAKALRTAQRAIDAASMNARAREENAGRYLVNTLRNVAHLVEGPDPGRLRGQFADVPAIVIGAGPSLDRTMEALRAVAGRALLIATDTAWRPLVSVGINPHLVVALDPTEANGRHLRGVTAARDTWVMAEGSVDPDALQALRGHVALFRVAAHHPWPWLQPLGLDRPQVRAWGSVLTSAYDVAIAAGCSPVVFVGSDLSFTDGRPYCRGTSMEQDWAQHAARGASLRRIWGNTISARSVRRERDVTGGETATAPHLLEFRNWLVARAGEEPPGRVINASGAGILMGPGITQADLGSLLSDRPDRDAGLRERIATAFAPRSGGDVAGLAAALRAVEAQASPDHRLESPVQEWLTFGRPRLTTEDIRAAAAAGRASLEAPPQAAAERPRASGVRAPRWYEADRVAHIRARLVNDPSLLDGTVARPASTSESRARAAADAAQAVDALLTLPRLATAPGADIARGYKPHRLPLSARFEWVEAARPLVAVLEESLVELGVCSRAELTVPATGDDFWSAPIWLTEGGTAPAARPSAIDAAARVALLADRLAIDPVADTDAAMRRRQSRFVGAILRGLADPRLRTARHGAIRLQPPASPYPISLPLRPEAVMRAMTGSLARPVAERDSRLVLAGESVAYCEPMILTNPARSPGWTVTTSGSSHAVFTPKDNTRSVVVDADGGQARGPAWPMPIMAEVPWGDEGGAIAWAHPSTVLLRPRLDAPVVSELVPFAPRKLSLGPDGSAYWLETSGALWEWRPGGTRRFVLFAPGAGFIRHEGHDVVLAPVERNEHGSLRRWRAAHEWRCDGTPHMRQEVPAAAEGQCCRVAVGAWTARSYPFSDLVRLEHRDGRAWLLACYSVMGVAWAGPSLAVTTLEGRLLLFPRLAERLEALTAGPGLAQREAERFV